MAARPPMPGAPGLPGGAPPGPPGGMPPPQPQMAPPPPGPPPSPGGAPIGATQIFTDLSVDMSPAWQMVDMGVRCFRTALKTPEFQNTEMGKVNAVIRTLTSTAVQLLSYYTGGSKPGNSSPKVGESSQEDTGDSGSVNSPDADAAPESGG